MEVDSLLCENVAHFCLLLPLSVTSWARNELESKENVSCERENMFYTLLGPYHRKNVKVLRRSRFMEEGGIVPGWLEEEILRLEE